MKIIGHRGAAGLALENTLPSIELARLLGVDAIEFDIHKTADGTLVLLHDKDLTRVADQNSKVHDLSLAELQNITLNDEQSVTPTLVEALKMAGDTPVIIEVKQRGCMEALLKILRDFPDQNITIASFKLSELVALQALKQDIPLYGLERTKPFEILQFAKTNKLQGVGLNFWLLNPLTYLLARRYNLQIYVYTVNNKLLGKFIGWLYPDVSICTNHPEWFIKHPWLKVRGATPAAKRRRSTKA